jgi:predicted CXXCH cytochrome family protein
MPARQVITKKEKSMEMKKVLALVAATGILAAASTSFAIIKGGKHDMSTSGSATLAGTIVMGTSTQICVYCHAPHNAYEPLPLWNREAGATAAGSFILYSSPSMTNAKFAAGFSTDSQSLFCMSCHDGATNVNNVKNVPPAADGLLTSALVGGDGAFGTDLGNNSAGTAGHTTHPINFPVSNNNQNDLWIGTGAFMGTDNTRDAAAAATGFQVYNNSRGTRVLECSSCHGVHNYDNSPFLRYTMAGSGLCLGCHNK